MDVIVMASDAIRSSLSGIKRWIQRNKCIKRGQKVKIQYCSEVRNTVFEDNAFVAHHASCIDTRIGNHTSIGRFTKIRLADIGKYCSISWDTTIGAVEHPLTRISTSALTYKEEYGMVERDIVYEQKETIIGNDVWIGCQVVIMSGVKIGDGAVIGAGAVVTKDIPPYAIAVGVPAKIIRYRVEEELIPRVERLKWWDWSKEDLKANIDVFEQELDREAIEKLERYKEEYIK